MRSRISYGSTGIIPILACLLVHVLSDESAPLEEYRFDDFDDRKYEDSVEQPLVRLFDGNTISKNININSNVIFSPIRSMDALLPTLNRKTKQDLNEDKLTLKLYAAVIFRENLLRVFGHALYISESLITESQYSSLYLIHEALRRNLVYVFNMLPIMHKIQGQRKTLQLKKILTELTGNLPPYLESTAKFLIQEIHGKRFSAEALFPIGVQNSPDFLANLEPELINLCKSRTSADEKKGYDESSEMTERILGPVFVKILYNLKSGEINLTQRLFAVILMSFPQNGGDPILDENIRYIFELSKFQLLPSWDIVRQDPEATDPYKLIYSTISRILARDEIPVFVRESLFYIRNHLSPITVTHINPMRNPIKKMLSTGFNVNLILSSIVLIDFSPDTVYLRDRLLYFIQNGYVDMQIVLDGMNTFIYDNPMDLLIALLTRMQKRLRPSYIEIHRTISALLSALVLKKEMCTFRPNISQNLDITTILGSLQNPALNVTVWKHAHSLYMYILKHPDQFNSLNTLIPSEKKKCVVPRQCIANIVIDIENIKNQITYEKLQILKQIILNGNNTWKEVCPNDSIAGNGTDNVIPKITNPENDQSKNPLIGHIYGNIRVDVPVIIRTTTMWPSVSSEGFTIGKVPTTKQAPSTTTTSTTAAVAVTTTATATAATTATTTATTATKTAITATKTATTATKTATTATTTATTTTTRQSVPTTRTSSTSTQYSTTEHTNYTTKGDPSTILIIKVDQSLTKVTETPFRPTKTTIDRQVTSAGTTVILDTKSPKYLLNTTKPPERDTTCCLLPQGIKPNINMRISLNTYGIPSVISGEGGAPPSSKETIVVPSIMILLSPPNTQTPLVELGIQFKTTILIPLEQIYGPQYFWKIFGTNIQIQLYPTNIALVLALLEKALLLPEVSTNVKLCLAIEKYIKVTNYLSIVLLMPVLSQYKHIKGNVIYSIINDNDPKQNTISETTPASLSQGSVCFPLLHPKYYLQAVDQQNPYAGLLPELPSILGYIESVITLKQLLVRETIVKLIGSHFNPLAYPNRGTLLCGILQAFSRLPYVQQNAKLSYIVKGYIKAILLPAMYTTIPSSFILSLPVQGSNEVPSVNWEPDLLSLMVTLPPARTLAEMAAMKVLNFLLSKQNLLKIIGIPKPPINTKRSVLLIQIIEGIMKSSYLQVSPIVIPVLRSYVQILKTNPKFDAPILWVWVNVYILETEIRLDEVILNSLTYQQLPYEAKLAYSSLMRYFTKHPQILQNLPGFAFGKYSTQGLYLRSLFIYLLEHNKVSPSVMHDIRILIPYIKLTGSGATPLPAPKIRPM